MIYLVEAFIHLIDQNYQQIIINQFIMQQIRMVLKLMMISKYDMVMDTKQMIDSLVSANLDVIMNSLNKIQLV
jgi:hypothetical protein